MLPTAVADAGNKQQAGNCQHCTGGLTAGATRLGLACQLRAACGACWLTPSRPDFCDRTDRSDPSARSERRSGRNGRKCFCHKAFT